MKSYILMVALSATTLVAFGNNQKSNKTANLAEQVSTETQQQNNGIDAVITYYLNLKNALASDNSEKAAEAGGKLKTVLVNLGKQEMTKKQQKMDKTVRFVPGISVGLCQVFRFKPCQ